MRKALAKEEGQRKKFTAKFSHIGKKVNYQGYTDETILLKDVIDSETNTLLTDHVWFTFTKGFQHAGIKEGDHIEFEARVKKYSKGYVNRRYNINQKKTDYKLSNPTKIKVTKPTSMQSS